MRSKASIVCLVCVSVGSLLSHGGAAAQSGDCDIDPESNLEVCRLQLDGPVAPNVTTEYVAGGTTLFRWSRLFMGLTGTGGGAGPSGISFYCPTRTTEVTLDDGTVQITVEVGAYYYVTLTRIDTGESVLWEFQCVYPGEPPPEPPPPPPTEEEFRERAEPLLRIETLLNPRVAFGGITGLDTWLWCPDPGDVPVSVDLRGWTAEAEMSAVRALWRISGPSPASFDESDCGSEASPAATWQPQTMGDHTIEFTTTWAGFWELSYLGVPTGPPAPLGPFDFDAPPVVYAVDEVVGVLE